MSLKKLFLAVLCCFSLVVVGCGGGGGSDTVAPNTNSTITGNVTLPADGAATLSPAIRAAIDLSKLTIRARVGANGTWVTGSFNATTGVFSFTLADPGAVTYADIEVVNSVPRVLVRARVNNIAAGQTNSGVDVGATSTAILAVIDSLANNNLTTTDIQGQVDLTTLVTAVIGWLRAPVAGDVNAANGNLIAALQALGVLNVGAYDKTVRDNLAAMKTALVTTASATPFLTYIAENFSYAGGGASEKETLRTTTESRLDRYSVTNYTFTITELVYVNATTIQTTVSVAITAALKPGKTGTVTSVNTTKTATLKWAKQVDGTWKIISGLPYTTDQLGF